MEEILLNQAHAWFLEITFVQTLVCVFVIQDLLLSSFFIQHLISIELIGVHGLSNEVHCQRNVVLVIH